MRISLEKLPFSDWKHGRTAALLRDLPYFPFTFRVVFYPWKSDSILHSRKLPPSKILSPKNWTMAFRNGETRTDVRRQRKRKRKKEKRGKNKEELSRSGAWALAFRHWPGWTTRLNNRRYVTGVYAFTDEEAGKEEREATVPTGRERGGGRGGGGRGRGRRGSQRSVQGGDHGGRSPTYGSQWHLEARTLFFSFLPFLACPQPLSLPLTSVPFCSSHVQAQPLSPRREWTRADLETESRGLRVQDRRSSRGLLLERLF